MYQLSYYSMWHYKHLCTLKGSVYGLCLPVCFLQQRTFSCRDCLYTISDAVLMYCTVWPKSRPAATVIELPKGDGGHRSSHKPRYLSDDVQELRKLRCINVIRPGWFAWREPALYRELVDQATSPSLCAEAASLGVRSRRWRLQLQRIGSCEETDH